MNKFVIVICILLTSALGSMAQKSTHWQCDTHNFEYDMALYFSLQKDGLTIDDYSNYEVAAFVGNECRGVAEILTLGASNESEISLGYLRIHSNQPEGEAISFKVYMKDFAEEYNISETNTTFKSQDLIGLPSNPTTLNFSTIFEDTEGNSFVRTDDSYAELVEIDAEQANDGIVTIPATVDHNGNAFNIVSISNNAFDNIDKGKVTVIDLSGTGVTNITVDRTNGLFKDFGENTLIILPEGTGNTAVEGEKNVVIGNMCTELSISETNVFNSPIAFKVKHAMFDRIFTPGVPSTIYLPFSIPSEEASKLGTFHTFKEISSEGTAVFNSAETGEIQANTPFIFIPGESITLIDITDASGNISVEVTGSSVGTNGRLIGTTTAITWDDSNAPENIYGFAAEGRDNVSIGAFVKAGVGASIAPYRAYLLIDDAASARSLYRVSIEDETTGINHASNKLSTDKGKWYYINGVQLETTPTSRGLYIKNGDKIIIK